MWESLGGEDGNLPQVASLTAEALPCDTFGKTQSSETWEKGQFGIEMCSTDYKIKYKCPTKSLGHGGRPGANRDGWEGGAEVVCWREG